MRKQPYNEAPAEVVTSDGTSDEIKLSVGVLQGDTLAPYLFDIVIDYVLRKATEKQILGINLQKGTTSRITRQGLYLTDLDYAEDIALLSRNFEDAQKLLTRVEEEALKVGLKINRGKTEQSVPDLRFFTNKSHTIHKVAKYYLCIEKTCVQRTQTFS